MAFTAPSQVSFFPTNFHKPQTGVAAAPIDSPSLHCFSAPPARQAVAVSPAEKKRKRGTSTVVAAAGDVSADGTTYLIIGAVAAALVGTAFPAFFSRKDLCPECDGAGFVRKTGAMLRTNAARKDLPQIVCRRCNGLGKLNQIDK